MFTSAGMMVLALTPVLRSSLLMYFKMVSAAAFAAEYGPRPMDQDSGLPCWRP